ncbi:MAG: hypothetical protein QOK06_929 [Acidimicrobiaceae bacterium]|jgi:hypothetical protein
MGAQRTSFDKLQRDRAKKAKAAAKRDKRQNGVEPSEEDVETFAPLAESDSHEELSAGELLARIEQIHQQLDAGTITFEDFEVEKAELLSRVQVD